MIRSMFAAVAVAAGLWALGAVATAEDKKEYKFDAKLTKGETTLSITYTNDVYKEGEYDRNLYLHAVSLKKKAK